MGPQPTCPGELYLRYVSRRSIHCYVTVGDSFAIEEYDRCEVRLRVSLWNRFSFFLIRNGSGSARKNCKRSRSNNVLLVKIEGSVCYTIYHPLPVVQGVNTPLY